MSNDSLNELFYDSSFVSQETGRYCITVETALRLIAEHVAAQIEAMRALKSSDKAVDMTRILHDRAIDKCIAIVIGGESCARPGEPHAAVPPPALTSEISVITPRSNSLPDLLDALEIHLVDYPTPENIHMQRKYLSDIRQHHLKPVYSVDACEKALAKIWDNNPKIEDVVALVLETAGLS